MSDPSVAQLSYLLKGYLPTIAGRWILFPILLLLLLLVACGGRDSAGQGGDATLPGDEGTLEVQLTGTPEIEALTPSVPLVTLALTEEDVTVAPLPLRAGFPFSVTAVIHNPGDVSAVEVPLLFHVSPRQDEIGYMSFLETLSVTVPASSSLSVEAPVNWNFAGGEHQLWVQVNRLPEAWQPNMPIQPEDDTSDNMVVLELMVDPFDAYSSDLCPGRVDVEVGPADVVPEPARQRVLVRVQNVGNQAVYNLPVVILGEKLTGIAYTPVIPPCGGTAEVYVEMDRPFEQGESMTVQINPSEWAGRLAEDDFENNQVAVSAGLAPGMVMPADSGLDDYDFRITTADIETPEPWIVLVTVHNLGTRDADMVPIRVENEADRKITDVIPIVQGEGLGVAAIRVGYLWTAGGTLTFTVNPEDVEGTYPETNRDNNIATFTLP